MKKYIKWGVIIIFLAVSLLIGVNVVGNIRNAQRVKSIANELAFIDVPISTRIEGRYLRKPTMENVINYSHYVVLGTMENVAVKERDVWLYRFTVKDSIVGQLVEKEVIIWGHEEEYEIGDDYILFLSLSSGTLRPYEIYLAHDYFIFRIVDGKLRRLIVDIPPFKEYTAPFGNGKYNNKDNFIKLLKDNKIVKKPPKDKAINKIDDYKRLFKDSDVVMEIKISAIDEIDTHICEPTSYTILSTYKGKAEEILFFLPGDIKLDVTYLIFLDRADGSYYRLTTRENSLLIHGTKEYEEALEKIK